jgi:hypothetical protein
MRNLIALKSTMTLLVARSRLTPVGQFDRKMKPLLLPEHGAAGELNQNVCIVLGKLKAAVEREFHGHERNPEIGAE